MQEAFQRAVLDAESALPSSWLPTQPESIAVTRGGRGGTDVPPNPSLEKQSLNGPSGTSK